MNGGAPYSQTPPPIAYNMKDYVQGQIINGTENGSYKLKKLAIEDMASYSRDDANKWYAAYGKVTTKLGPEMTDREFKDFFGQTS